MKKLFLSIIVLGLLLSGNAYANDVAYLECYKSKNKEKKEIWIIDYKKKIVKEFITAKDFKITSLEEDLVRAENGFDNIFFNRFSGEMMKMVVINNATDTSKSEYYKCINKKKMF